MSSTSSVESADSALDSKERASVPSPSVRSIRSAAPSLQSTGQASPSTQMSESSAQTDSPQMELLSMPSVGDSPAKTSASPGQAQGSPALAAAYGPSTPVLLANYDRDTSSWRTCQLSLLGGLEEFSETWPRSGMTRSGTAYQLQPLVPLTSEIASGLWPTPTASLHNLNEAPDTWEERRIRTKERVKNGNGFGTPLTMAVKMWRTPTASDATKWNNQSMADRLSKGQSLRLCTQVSPEGGKGGLLNPTWVEWLMGFPLGWTVCEAWETRSSRRSRKSSAGQS